MRRPLNVLKIRPLQFGAYDPISNTHGMVRAKHTRAHQGWDLLAPVGTSVYAIANGELKRGQSATYGKWLSLGFSHRGQTYFAFYAHLCAFLQGNSSVLEGAMIGLTGRSGNASKIPISEAHLHFEIRTVESPGHGLAGRIDPGEIFGYEIYSSAA
jgi:murein DD-endopeptidase MepM/ murein hydrolase activator NlpD